jgi:inositol transport system substrate-binding protein
MKVHEKQKRKIFLLMTCLPDVLSKAAQVVMNYRYNHVSLGFEEDMNTYYTFTYKGFTVEDITRRANKPDREPFPCELYEIEVSNAIYQDIYQRVCKFVEFKNTYRYTKLGAALRVFLNIPTRRARAYYCSQFVAEILKNSGAARLDKWAPYYLPPHLARLRESKFIFQGNLQEYLRKYHIVSAASYPTQIPT